MDGCNFRHRGGISKQSECEEIWNLEKYWRFIKIKLNFFCATLQFVVYKPPDSRCLVDRGAYIYFGQDKVDERGLQKEK